MARASVVIAGGARGVESMRDLLESADQPLPWVCIRDRDFLETAERDERCGRPGLYVLSRRDIENLVIDEVLLWRTLERAGSTVGAPRLSELLVELAETQKEEVLEHLVERRLAVDVPLSKPEDPGRWGRAKAGYGAIAEANRGRLNAFDDVLESERKELDEVWSDSWKDLVDGKVMLRMLVPHSPFKDVADLTAAIQRTCVDELETRPAALVEMVDLIAAVASSA